MEITEGLLFTVDIYMKDELVNISKIIDREIRLWRIYMKQDCDGDDKRNYIRSRMDCRDYQKDNGWLGYRIVMEMTEGVISEEWIVVINRKIIGC